MKKIWITGASSGIGKAVAIRYAQPGNQLVLCGRNMSALEAVALKCKGAGAVDILAVDISDFDAVFANFATMLAKVGGADVLVNNAGLSQRSLAAETDFSVDQKLINTDLLGTIAVTKALLPALLCKQGAQIIVISSLMGKFGAPLRSAYAAAKHGLHGFFDALRAENYRQELQILLVCPGYVKTNISVNAITASGTTQGTMDDATAKGLTPEKVAEKIEQALKNNKHEIYPGGAEVRGVWMKRFLPRTLARILQQAKTT